MRIGLDIDGVLANFNRGYIRLLNQLTGKDADEEYQPTRWHYEADLGFTKEEVNHAWRAIEADPEFWYNLHRAPGISPRTLFPLESTEIDLYFITTRPGPKVKFWTEAWLEDDMLVVSPTVLISKHKGLAAAALELDVYLDDKGENIEAVEHSSPKTRAYLLDQLYNQLFTPKLRVKSVQEMLEKEGF